MRSARPRRSSAAAATTMASCVGRPWPAGSAMLPAQADEAEVGPAVGAAAAWRRSEPVATSAPSGRSASVEPTERVAGVAPLGHGGEDEAGRR